MNTKSIKIRTGVVFLLTFLAAVGCVWFVNHNQEKEEKLKAAYTAESTVSRVESQLNKYLAESDLIKRMIKDGQLLSDDEFAELSAYMQDEQNVITAHELAKDGIVSQVYPQEGNEEAIGLNMLENPERKVEANLAKESGQYTIAGPFKLVQGGTGTLLFDPIYRSNDNQELDFWGFSILVIDWEKFLKEVELDKLSDAGYHYQIWKKSSSTHRKITIAQCPHGLDSDTLRVSCKVPNDTWYFEIAPVGGWVSDTQVLFGVLISFVLAMLGAAGYWQTGIRRYRDRVHESQMQKALQEARQASDAKSRFLFNMSHDIRTPLNAITGFADLLEKHVENREKTTEYVGKIKPSSALLLSLINYVLEMARIESGKMTLKSEKGCFTELMDSLQAVFEPDIRKKNLTYTTSCEVEHEYILCDKMKIQEIFLNIVSNAIKYTPDGGKISVTITELEGDGNQDHVANYRAVIEDNGIGMSEEYLPHIFEEFSRERTSTESKVIGTGLGLPIVKAIIELMKGTIRVESKLGEGTRMIVELPLHFVEENQMDDNQKYQKEILIQKMKGKRILLAEDNDLNAEIAETILKENGFEVDRAEDGIMCVAKLQKQPENYYDVILMDIQMPNMNGYEATEVIRNLKNTRAKIPIIAMTANAFDEDRQKALDVGMNAHVAKPIDIDALFQTLGRILKE